jgi:hypothetical protein
VKVAPNAESAMLAITCGDSTDNTTYLGLAAFGEPIMRRLLFAAALVMCPVIAMADETISGQWQANQGHGVVIAMDVLVDGHWFSQTIQGDKVVAEMAGTYEQTKKTDASGKLVFTPVTSKTTAAHGAAKVEDDDYTLSGDGKVLRLVTKGEAMVFHKQPLATK